MAASLLEITRKSAVDNGFDLFGVVAAATFDACQPKDQRTTRVLAGCGAVAVLGCTGQRRDDGDVASRLVAFRAALDPRLGRVVLAEPGRCGLSFARLAEAAGLGTVSPVTGLLLHPEFGPWVRVHAALLVVGSPFGELADATMSDHFQPCCKCSQPCLEVLDESTAACHLGAEHRHGAATPVPQMVAAMARTSPLQRLRMRALRFVPTYLRF